MNTRPNSCYLYDIIGLQKSSARDMPLGRSTFLTWTEENSSLCVNFFIIIIMFLLLKSLVQLCACFFNTFPDCKNAGMSKNPNFLEQVSSHFGKADGVIVGCHSGGRSLRATAELLDAVCNPLPTKLFLTFEAYLLIFFSFNKYYLGITAGFHGSQRFFRRLFCLGPEWSSYTRLIMTHRSPPYLSFRIWCLLSFSLIIKYIRRVCFPGVNWTTFSLSLCACSYYSCCVGNLYNIYMNWVLCWLHRNVLLFIYTVWLKSTKNWKSSMRKWSWDARTNSQRKQWI